MQITSPSFNHGQMIPKKYTCDGENINPPLEIQNIPDGVKSLVIIMDDPDSPNGTFTHWTVLNISPDTTLIKEHCNFLNATEGINSFQEFGYGGPCPHFGTHHYFFKLYALDTILDLSPQTEKSEIELAMENHILEKAELVGLYSKL